MPSTLVELRYSGRPNPRIVLDADTADAVWRAIGSLPLAVAKVNHCLKCRTPAIVTSPDLLLSRTDGDLRESAFLVDRYVVTPQGTRIDERDTIARMVAAIVQALHSQAVVSGIAPTSVTALGNPRRCTHAPGHHALSFPGCTCGSPADAERWLPMDICENSNCFNFAVKDPYCQPGTTVVGAMPASFPTNWRDHTEWAAILAPDGLFAATDHTTVPAAAAAGGWHVALAVKVHLNPLLSDFHFLRLDGAHWSHKYSQKPPQTCDAAGAPIPAGDLAVANLCGYELVGYFYVERALQIDH